MKLRLDLLEHLTMEDVLEGALLTNHRYTAAPVFSTTGVGQLKTATPEDSAAEDAYTEAMIARVKERAMVSDADKRANP